MPHSGEEEGGGYVMQGCTKKVPVSEDEVVLFLSVNRFRLHGHGSLLERLREGWVSVRCPGYVLGAGTVFDSQDSFRDHLSSVGA